MPKCNFSDNGFRVVKKRTAPCCSNCADNKPCCGSAGSSHAHAHAHNSNSSELSNYLQSSNATDVGNSAGNENQNTDNQPVSITIINDSNVNEKQETVPQNTYMPDFARPQEVLPPVYYPYTPNVNVYMPEDVPDTYNFYAAMPQQQEREYTIVIRPQIVALPDGREFVIEEEIVKDTFSQNNFIDTEYIGWQ